MGMPGRARRVGAADYPQSYVVTAGPVRRNRRRARSAGFGDDLRGAGCAGRCDHCGGGRAGGRVVGRRGADAARHSRSRTADHLRYARGTRAVGPVCRADRRIAAVRRVPDPAAVEWSARRRWLSRGAPGLEYGPGLGLLRRAAGAADGVRHHRASGAGGARADGSVGCDRSGRARGRMAHDGDLRVDRRGRLPAGAALGLDAGAVRRCHRHHDAAGVHRPFVVGRVT